MLIHYFRVQLSRFVLFYFCKNNGKDVQLTFIYSVCASIEFKSYSEVQKSQRFGNWNWCLQGLRKDHSQSISTPPNQSFVSNVHRRTQLCSCTANHKEKRKNGDAVKRAGCWCINVLLYKWKKTEVCVCVKWSRLLMVFNITAQCISIYLTREVNKLCQFYKYTCIKILLLFTLHFHSSCWFFFFFSFMRVWVSIPWLLGLWCCLLLLLLMLVDYETSELDYSALRLRLLLHACTRVMSICDYIQIAL